MSIFRTTASRHVYRGFSSVRVDRLEGPDGAFEREVVEHPDAVAVVALDEDMRVALVRQYRHPLGLDLLELPAGTLDVPGEPPREAAHRELAEEVGLATSELVALGAMWNSAGWTDERTHLFLARTTAPIAVPPGFLAEHEEAAMSIEWRPFATLLEEVGRGDIEDAKTAVGILRAAVVLGAGGGEVDGGSGDATR